MDYGQHLLVEHVNRQVGPKHLKSCHFLELHQFDPVSVGTEISPFHEGTKLESWTIALIGCGYRPVGCNSPETFHLFDLF